MKDDKNNPTLYIATFIVIIIVLIVMFLLLHMANDVTKKRYVPETTTTTKKKDEPVIVTNFTAPLALIIGDTDFYENYEKEIRYSGAKFIFKCQDFDQEKDICAKGIATMDAGTATVTLFEYSDEENNYLKKSGNYYIIVNDDYIILVSDGIKDKVGSARVISRYGKDVMTIDNIITGYIVHDEYYSGMYPAVEGNNFNYYMCDSGKVKIATSDLTNKDNFKILQNVDEGICN